MYIRIWVELYPRWVICSPIYGYRTFLPTYLETNAWYTDTNQPTKYQKNIRATYIHVNIKQHTHQSIKILSLLARSTISTLLHLYIPIQVTTPTPNYKIQYTRSTNSNPQTQPKADQETTTRDRQAGRSKPRGKHKASQSTSHRPQSKHQPTPRGTRDSTPLETWGSTR